MEIALAATQVALLVALLIVIWRGPIAQPQTKAPATSLFRKLAETVSPSRQPQAESVSYRERMSPEQFADYAERRYIELRQKEESEKEKANAR